MATPLKIDSSPPIRPPTPVFGAALPGTPIASGTGWPARQEVESYATLAQNWGDREGRPPPQQEINNALAVIDEIQGTTSVSPLPCATGDAEIVLGWQLPNNGCLKLFFEDGEFAYICLPPEGEETDAECAFADEEARKALIDDIKRLLSVYFPAPE